MNACWAATDIRMDLARDSSRIRGFFLIKLAYISTPYF